MADLNIAIDTSLARDLFASLDYPYRMRVGSRLLGDAEPETRSGADVLLDWGAGDDGVPEDQIVQMDAAPLLEAVVEGYLDQKSAVGLLYREADPEAEALVASYADGLDPQASGTVAQVLAKMAADDGFEGKAKAFLAARLSSGVDWVEAELSQRPNVAMGNPLTLHDLKFAVRARLRGCIRVFGREICVSVTTPWIRFEGRRAALFLDVVGTRIYGRARVSDIDFVWRIEILRWTVTIRVGVTGLINRQLEGQRPLLADFSTVAITVPGVARTYRPNAVSVPPGTSETRIEVDGDFTRS